MYYAFGEVARRGGRLYEAGDADTFMPFTYSPIAAHAFGLLTVAPFEVAAWMMLLVSIAALAATATLLLRAFGARGPALLGMSAGTTGIAVWLEPVQNTLMLGQVNLLLCAVVTWGATRRAGSRMSGIGIGLAAAVKITSGLFLVHLLLTRQYRALAAAVGAFLSATALGAFLSPRDSWMFWSRALWEGTDRIAQVTPVGYVANQSLHGSAIRMVGADAGAAVAVATLVLVVPIAVMGLYAALHVHKAGEPLAAVGLVGVLSLLLSPVSWSHHWVWVVLVLLVGADLLRRRSGHLSTWAQGVAMALLVALVVAFAAWPGSRQGHIEPTGLIWHQPWDYRPEGTRPEYRWNAAEQLAGNAYVISGLFIVLLAAAIAVLGVRGSSRTPPAVVPERVMPGVGRGTGPCTIAASVPLWRS